MARTTPDGEPSTGTTSRANAGADRADDEVLVRGTDLEKSYRSGLFRTRKTSVLEQADIEIWAGEIVGIVGENGAGKSTLMNVLVGVLDADSGTVERHGAVGWCPQEPLLYDRLTVSETFRLFGAGYGMTREEIDAARTQLAERLDFEQYLEYRIDRLSGGNRQKVNLGVALMHDPDVLMLDEPYTGFDWETYIQFWELAGDLAADGTAIAMISHLIEERNRLDRIYEIRDGLVHDVTHQNERRESDSERHPRDGGLR